MVRYTGRQKTITGAVNRNQVGLKMSGCPSRVGRSGKNIRLLGRRVNCMYGLCGPTMVNGAPWRTSGRNEPPYCRQRSTSCAQAAGGVGHINSPYTRTRVPAAGKQGCTEIIVGGGNTPWWYNNPAVLAALSALSSYLASLGQQLALLGKSETLQGDFNGPSLLDDGIDHLYHYFDGASDYATLISTRPDLVAAIELINSIPFSFTVPVYGTFVDMVHTVGGVTAAAAQALDDHGIGFPIDFGSGVSLTAYGSFQCWDIVNKVNLSDQKHNGLIGVETVYDTGWTDTTALDWFPALNCSTTPNCSDGVLTGGGMYTYTGDATSGTGFYIVSIFGGGHYQTPPGDGIETETPEGGWKIYRVRSKGGTETPQHSFCGCDWIYYLEYPSQSKGCETMYFFDTTQPKTGGGAGTGIYQRCLPPDLWHDLHNESNRDTLNVNCQNSDFKTYGIKREPPGAWVTSGAWKVGGGSFYPRLLCCASNEPCPL